MAADWTSALARARAHAPYLARLLERSPKLAELLAAGEGEQALRQAKLAGLAATDTGMTLRLEKQALGLVLAIGDLANAFDLARVMRELSAFADRALHAAIGAAIARRVGEGAGHDGFIALALGKHGSGELNYSSDIDPILLYDPASLPRRERDEPAEAAQRYAREIVRLLSDQTSEGYVFRVDLRLRPASEVSPLAISTGAATTHYESSALAWERAAFIRARSCAGDIAAGEAFLDGIRSFVWRRSLDFGAIEAIRALSLRIRDRYRGPLEPRPGYDLKQGRGGIREIEFAAQTLQLIHGGRNPDLRVRDTRSALRALAKAGHLDRETADILGRSYARLRTIEHRVQMIHDRQTHVLPDGAALDGVAQLDGLDDGAALLSELQPLTGKVARIFDELIALEPASGVPQADRSDPIRQRVAGWQAEGMRGLRSPSAQAAFAQLEPQLVQSLHSAPDPQAALTRFERMLERLPSALNLFRLLEARPAVMAQLVNALSLAPPLADALTQRPQLLDRLIDRSAFALPGKTKKIARAMRRVERGDAYEQRLDRIRMVTGENRFALGMQLIEGVHDPLAIAAALSRVAEAGIRVALEASQQEFAERHGRFADGELVVLGLGRLGGGVLTHSSDLDCIYLFTEGAQDESDGPKPLARTLYFNRLAQRVTAALSVATAHGALYDVDTRLRPQGAQGPLAVGMASFARYQCEAAWTWEHMALQRARVIAGSDPAASEVDVAMRAALTRPRDVDTLRQDVLAMRAEMAAHKPPAGPLDVKLLRGGLIDIEFLVHFLQLREGLVGPPQLDQAIEKLAECGFLPATFGDSHAALTRLLIAVRLLAPQLERTTPASEAALARAVGAADFAQALAFIAEARHAVASTWHAVFGESLDLDTGATLP